MADVELVIKIPEEMYEIIQDSTKYIDEVARVCEDAVKVGTLLPKGHGKLVDIGKIDDDRIDRDNPIIPLTINGEYIEAISLDYLNGLPTIIEAEREDGT